MVKKDHFNKAVFNPVKTRSLRLDIKLQGQSFKRGELGPPDANYLTEDITWHEGGIIECKIMKKNKAGENRGERK